MKEDQPDPMPQAALPDAIRDRLRQAPSPRNTSVGQRLREARDAARARFTAGAADVGVRTQLAAAARRIKATAAAKPSWLSLRKVKVSPEVRGEIIDRGRRAGLSIGTALDKIVRQIPDDRTARTTARPLYTDADVATVAIQRSVKQPSIFAPGHILTALLTGGIVHIATTFSITALGTGSAYRALKPVLPANELVVLPAQAPGAQVLPYLAPDMLYAFCRFDLSRGPIEIAARLPEAGWSLALYTRQGDNFYATPGQSQKPTTVAFLLAPTSDRLINLAPGVRKSDVDLSQVTSPDLEGLLVLRAPLKGVAFEAAAQAELKRAKCAPARK